MSVCRVFSCYIGRGFLLWPVCSLGKTLLAFALLHSVLQGQTCLLLQVSLVFLLLHSSPLWCKGHLFWGLVLESLIDLHRTVQFQLLQHYWLGHRLGLLWYWMVCLGNEQRSLCHFWDCSPVLHFRLLFTTKATHFLPRDSCPSVQFSRSVVSNSLQPHESQHARLPCPSPAPGVHSDSRPSSPWCHPTISSSVVPFSSCP